LACDVISARSLTVNGCKIKLLRYILGDGAIDISEQSFSEASGLRIDPSSSRSLAAAAFSAASLLIGSR
jgi:hypothetical protein